MTDLVKIHSDILMALNEVTGEPFKTTTIRDLLTHLFPHYKNPNTTRLFASRHLTELENKGVLTSTGVRHGKRYKKCNDYHLIKFKTKKPRKNQHVVNYQINNIGTMSDVCIKSLKTQKATMEAELSIKLAETEQYQAMIEQFPETASLALKLHSEAKENAAAIVGQIRAISNVLSYQ